MVKKLKSIRLSGINLIIVSFAAFAFYVISVVFSVVFNEGVALKEQSELTI